MNRKILFSYAVLAFLSLVIAYAGGYLTHAEIVSSGAEFNLLKQAHQILADHGLAPLPENPSLEYGMIRGMLEAYNDPYTIFVEPVQHELDSNALEGSFGGIGARLIREENGDVLLYPFPDGPAASAGVIDADQLLRVDNLEVVSSISLDEILAALRGPVGEVTEIIILRQPDGSEMEFSIRRESVQLPSVTWHILPDETRVGVIEVNILAASTPDEIQNAVEDLKASGATHFLLDLRDNGGGLLDAGVDTARLFLRDGVIIEQQYRGQGKETFAVDSPGTLADIPLAILVNGNTASAAEIVAGALQAQNRAVLIGTPSFGKDSIQLVFNLSDNSSLHVTAARWGFPGLEFPGEGHGLIPEMIVEPGDSDVDNVVLAAAAAVLAGR